MQDYQTNLNKDYTDKLEAHDLKYKGSKTDAEWIKELTNNPVMAARYKKEREAILAKRTQELRDYQRGILNRSYQKGGSIEDKKELLRYKEEMKQIGRASCRERVYDLA